MSDDQIDDVTGRAKGGAARAAKLTPEERSQIAKKGAAARWSMPKAIREGSIKIGDLELPCAVLEDGRRVLTQSGVMLALGRARQVKSRKYFDADVNLPAFLQAKNLKPFISSDLEVTSSRIDFLTLAGAKAFGFTAEVLPAVCEVFIDAEREQKLTESQRHIAVRARVLYRGFAKLGIIALVDEATGYQEIRARDALQAYLERFIRKELAAWVKTFPDEFFRELYRLKRWPWSGSSRRPGVVGRYIKDLVYERLGPGVIAELEHKNPSDGKGQRRSKHFQWLTEDIGHPALAQHMHALIGFMRAEDDWESFKSRFYRAFPKKGETLSLL
jgi:P63C domain